MVILKCWLTSQEGQLYAKSCHQKVLRDHMKFPSNELEALGFSLFFPVDSDVYFSLFIPLTLVPSLCHSQVNDVQCVKGEAES